MFDTNNGKCLRKITEAHPYGNSILHVKFTDDPTVACFSDSGGSVFMLEFKRTMGVRGADSTCIFSGSRGEVQHFNLIYWWISIHHWFCHLYVCVCVYVSLAKF